MRVAALPRGAAVEIDLIAVLQLRRWIFDGIVEYC